MAQLMPQVVGVAAVAGFVLLASFVGWLALKAIVGLRVSAEEEHEGLDIGEHGNQGYPEFYPADVAEVSQALAK
jgi:Amt family ammonium transporter